MDYIFFFLSIGFVVTVMIGLIKPSALGTKWVKSRGGVLRLYGSLAVISIIIFVVVVSSQYKQQSPVGLQVTLATSSKQVIASALATSTLKAIDISYIDSVYSSKYKNAKYTVEHFISDGISTVYSLGDMYDDVDVYQNGTSIPGLGIWPQSCIYNVCWNREGKQLIFKVPPRKGTEITFSGASSVVQNAKTQTSWAVTHTWADSSLKTTETFVIDQTPWKIKWSNSTNQGRASILQVYLMDADTNAMVELLANSNGSGQGENYVYRSGKFYLKINNANGSWAVQILELSSK